MTRTRTWLLAASTIILTTACATPEERMAKLQIKQQRLELKTQQLAQRNETRGKTQTSAVLDQRAPLENVVKALAACDATLGATIKQFAPDLTPIFPVTVKGEVAAIDVPDRKTPGRNTVQPTAAAKVYGLTLSGYYEESTEINGTLQKMAWGFVTPASPAQAAAVLGTVIPNFKRVSKEINGNYVRMEIFDRDGWHRTSRFDYYRAQPNLQGERTLVIEASRDPALPGSRIGCAVRGFQTEQFQGTLRPELG
ncbi:hypothetical protein [Herbaspirillum sp.]|uniref:hypothetical protein n=1 Tax=Herbaspirillum sp. TaxID=1890675 RepID=UPI001B260681|nr:hypothetical protein [Herbaspirillum sp.]MBO9538200.1 hypothetical protein [Herbaspirillum sp.]